MSAAQVKCPRCRSAFEVPSVSGKVKCPECAAVLNLGSGAKRDARRQGKAQDTDNKLALQLLGIIGGIALLVVIFTLASGDDKEPVAEKKKDDRPDYASVGGDYKPPAKPNDPSSVPSWLAQTLLIGMGEEDDTRIEKIIWWDKLFAQLGRENNWEEERRYANLDEAGKEKARDLFLTKLMDPDYCELIASELLEALKGDAAPPDESIVEADYGNIRYYIRNMRGKPRLEFLVKCQLVDGRDPVSDAEAKDAWLITSIKYMEHGKIKDGRKVKKKRSSFGAEIGKKPKVKKPRRTGPIGPHEAQPAQQEWVAGTSDSMQSKIAGLVSTAQDQDNVRKADMARNELMSIGKPAIPGILNGLIPLNHKDNETDIAKAWPLVQALREITEQRFGYGPTTAATKGRFGMTRATPEERETAVRRWFGWWEQNAKSWEKKVDTTEDSWDDPPGK